MTTQEEQLVQAGDDAEALLSTDAFDRVINGLVDVVNTLKQQVSVRDEILAKGDNSQEEA